MTREEQKDVQRLKKAAKEGQMGAVQEIAKAIAKNRKHVTQLYKLETKLQSFHTQIQGIKSQAVMLKGIREITRAMGQMNKSFSVGAFSIILNEFKSQSLELSTKEEMIEEMNSSSDEELETDEIVNKVLDEIGINLKAELNQIKPPEPKQKEEVGADEELQKRYENLTKNKDQ